MSAVSLSSTCQNYDHFSHNLANFIRLLKAIPWKLNITLLINRVRVMVKFNATFNNISVISWRSVLLVKETRVSIENHQPAVSHWQTLSHNVVSSTPRHERDLNSQHYISSSKFNYRAITTTTGPYWTGVVREWPSNLEGDYVFTWKKYCKILKKIHV